jgi:circadian clock protein KaiC
MMDEQRISSGMQGFDEITQGGLVSGRSYLIVGGPGAGKTLFSLQWLLEGKRCGDRCLYVTLAEPAGEIIRNAAIMGWDLAGIDLVDLSPATEPVQAIDEEYHIFPPSEVEQLPVWSRLLQAIRGKQPQRIVIDSITQLRYLSTDEYQFRKHILGLVHFLNQHKATALLSFESTELERETSVALAVDGIIRLSLEISPSLAIGLRSIQVEKLRGSHFLSGRHPLRIGPQGIEIYPHRIEDTGSPHAGEQLFSSGIPRLDELLGGGLESGTTTLITGPTGVGKTTLGTQFLAHEAAAGKRAALFTFEEPSSYIAKRSLGIGRPIDTLLEDGRLKIVRVNPLELYPDQFLALVRKSVEQDGCQMVMIDSLRGYQLAMEEFGSPQAHIHNLAIYLTRREVTSLFINEIELIAGADLRATDLGVSHLADNILLLRHAEHAGQIIKVIGCLKKRLGNFQSGLRQIQITQAGLQVGEQLAHLHGVLTSLPTFVAQDPSELGEGPRR